MPGEPLPQSWLDAKKLTAEVARKYRITREGKVIYFGVADETGKLQGIAGRNYGVPKHDEKHFFWKKKSPLLYGLDTLGKSTECILTVGFWDAPSAYILTGMPALSIPNGDTSAKKTVIDSFHLLKRLRRIYVCFDNDSSGQSAAKEVMEVLGYRGRLVNLPDFGISLEHETVYTKDASDFLVYGLKDEFKRAIERASTSVQPYIHTDTVDELYAEYKLRGFDSGWSTGIPELDSFVKIRRNEFTLFFGAPGRGKSTFTRYLVSAIVRDGVKPYYISLEDPVWLAIDNLAQVVLHEHTPYNAEGKCTLSRKELLERAKRVREKVMIANLESCTPEMLEDAIECAYVQYGCQFIAIDHITWLLNLSDDQRAEAVKYMNVIAALCKKFPIHVFVVSHNKPADVGFVQGRNAKNFRPDWEEYLDPTPRDAQWSSVFEQVSWNIWAWKNPSDLETPAKLHILKNRTGGMKKLGVVMCYFDETYNSYMGVKQYAKSVSGKQRNLDDRRNDANVSLDTRKDDFGALLSDNRQESTHLSALHALQRESSSDRTRERITEEGQKDNRDSDDRGVTDIPEKIQTPNMEPRLSDEKRDSDRVQGRDGGCVSKDSGDFQNSASFVVSQIKATLHEARFETTQTDKHELPGVGRLTRRRVGLLQSANEEKSGRDTGLLAEIEFPIQSDDWASLL